ENNKATKVRDAIDLDKFLRSDPVWIQPLKTRIASLDIFESACEENLDKALWLAHEVEVLAQLYLSTLAIVDPVPVLDDEAIAI
ncbi:hypothetical protein MJI69_31595, partial [Salmonella enterica subsp. enterica serovar Anatum]|nr:hypothetical protein [Salmonella enterica subsp. enterica serovar Anatum]